MADANGIIFRNPTLNTWFVGPTVDLTAWNVITVSAPYNTTFSGNYVYDASTNQWGRGLYILYKGSSWTNSSGVVTDLGGVFWVMTDRTTLYTAADNGSNTPPTQLFTEINYPLEITVVGAGTTGVNGAYTYDSSAGGWLKTGGYGIGNDGESKWIIDKYSPSYRAESDMSETPYPPKIGWVVIDGTNPPPELEYNEENFLAPCSISTASTATWASASPTSGFVSLTDTLDSDFGYVVTLDVWGGANYPYYKYCTKAEGEVYGTFPAIPERYGYIFAGWYSEPEGQGTKIEADTVLLESADHTLYAKWVSFISGPILNAAGLFSQFTISIGTDVLAEPIAPNYAISVGAIITLPIPITAVTS